LIDFGSKIYKNSKSCTNVSDEMLYFALILFKWWCQLKIWLAFILMKHF